MYILLTVICLLIGHVSSYPSVRQENNDLQLEVRSILNHLNDEFEVNKRQGGYNTINPDLKCEIECVGKLRDPETGKGASIREATRACQNICAQLKPKKIRSFIDSDSNGSSDEQF